MPKKITRKDWDAVEHFILDEMETRKQSKDRKRHENIWREVDRQVYMESLKRTARSKNDNGDWRNAIELGELSRASEVITADIRRLTFPQNRSWFDSHIQLEGEMTEQGPVVDSKAQRREDGKLRAMMTQQHLDFGFKSRVDLSVKEALHHGSYVTTVDWERAVQVQGGTGVRVLSAPVWTPHSMWNCYPDPSVGPTNTFYQGSMILVRYKPLHQVKKMVSENASYPYFNLNKIKKQKNKRLNAEDTEDIELTYFYGDLVLPRARQDLMLLNSRAILANGTIIHYMPNPNPYPTIIYNGWERLDVRDPYYVSPLVKFSADQKIGSILANRLLDAVDLKTEPPGTYDGNDPDFMANGGPDLSPGSMTPNKHGGNVQFYDVGDPQTTLAGLQFIVSQIEAGTKVDRVRSGVSASTEQTATEVIKQSQNAELSTIDFVDKHEAHGLRPALYMQNDLNRIHMVDYRFFNQELDAPDFEVMRKSDLKESVHYEIVGSKGLLDEERRQQQTSQVAAFWLSNRPDIVNEIELAMDMFRDAGNKNPERFLKVSEQDQLMKQQLEQAIQQIQEQAAQQMQQLADQIQELDDKLRTATVNTENAKIDGNQKDVEKAQKDVVIQALREQIKLIKAEQGLADMANNQINDLREAVVGLLETQNAPKKVIFDESGRPVGIETEKQELNS